MKPFIIQMHVLCLSFIYDVLSALQCPLAKRPLQRWHIQQWLIGISMKLPLTNIELGPIYSNRLRHKFSFSDIKMRLADL